MTQPDTIKQRDTSIDIARFFACLLIINSHCDALYGRLSFLATGGSIGNGLFFFCAGFVAFIMGGGVSKSKIERFDNWYKRRLCRMYAALFAFAALAAALGLDVLSVPEVIARFGGFWFLACIMLHYALLFVVNRWISSKTKALFTICFAACFVLFVFEDSSVPAFNMYNAKYIHRYFLWVYYFCFTLLGFMVQKVSVKTRFFPAKDLICLIASVALYYSVMALGYRLRKLQIVSLFPLLLAVYFFWKVCNSAFLKWLFETKVVGRCMKTISLLTLEAYIVQAAVLRCIGDKWNFIFPLNIVLAFVLTLFFAYVVNVAAKLFLQTFRDGPYEWKAILLVK